MLRLWDGPLLPRGSRITLQHITLYHAGSGLRLHFASPTALLNYLDAHLEARPDAPERTHLRIKEDL